MLSLPRAGRTLLAFAFLLGCARGLKPQPAVGSPENVVTLARDRVIPDRLRSRFHIKLRSDKLDIAGSTGGGLVVSRPGKGYFAVMGPLGGPIVSFTADGSGMAVLLAKQKRHLRAEEAEAVIREVTADAAGLDDLLAVLVGDLPFESARLKSYKAVEGGVRAVFIGPKRTSVVALLDPSNGTLRQVEAHKQKTLLLKATYEAYEEVDGTWLPTEVAVTVPSIELDVTLKYKGWKQLAPDEVPDVFKLDAPKGLKSEPLEAALEKMKL